MANTVTIARGDLHEVSHNGDPIMVTDNMFGGIYTTFQSKNHALVDYAKHSEALGVSGNVRYCGGTFAKSKIDEDDWDNDGNTTEYCYDLSNDDLNLKVDYTGDDDFGLSGTMKYALKNGLSLTIIVPVDRYYDNPEEGMKVFEDFLERLYIDQEFGILADKIILEFGNEDIATGDVASAVSYGTMTDKMLTVLNDFLAENLSLDEQHDIEVAVQTGRDPETDEAVRARISG
ncbi:MAG: hypothetical protein H5U17_13340, partial [Defluviimonas sp.]|nr:hypothetical protein [Defluviimonas sp.]